MSILKIGYFGDYCVRHLKANSDAGENIHFTSRISGPAVGILAGGRPVRAFPSHGSAGAQHQASTLPYSCSCPKPGHIVMGRKLQIEGEAGTITPCSLPRTAHPARRKPKGHSSYSLPLAARQGTAYPCAAPPMSICATRICTK